MAKVSDLTREAEIDWIGPPLAEEAWQRLRALAAAGVKDDDFSQIGPILVSDKRIALLAVLRINDETRWHLHIRARPTSDPPQPIVERTQRVGGSAGLMALLELAATDVTTAQYRIRATLTDADWVCQVLPHAPRASDPVLRLDSEAIVEHVGYRLINGPIGLSEITIIYLHEQGHFRVAFLAKGLVDLGDTFSLPYADDVLGLVIRTFFRTRDGTTD